MLGLAKQLGTKFFSSTDGEIDEQIDKFFNSNPQLHILDVNHSTTSAGAHQSKIVTTAIVTYKKIFE